MTRAATMAPVHARFTSALLIAGAGGALVAGAFSLTPASERWLTLAVGCGALLVLTAAFAMPGRGTVQRAIDPLLAVICAWTIVCPLVIERAGVPAGHVRWWSFACGAAICGLGILALLLHEWRIEHELRRTDQRLQIAHAFAVQAWDIPDWQGIDWREPDGETRVREPDWEEPRGDRIKASRLSDPVSRAADDTLSRAAG